jgi:hypothetical protein
MPTLPFLLLTACAAGIAVALSLLLRRTLLRERARRAWQAEKRRLSARYAAQQAEAEREASVESRLGRVYDGQSERLLPAVAPEFGPARECPDCGGAGTRGPGERTLCPTCHGTGLVRRAARDD